MKTGSTLSRTESVWLARLAHGRYPLPMHRHKSLDRMVRRGLARLVRIGVGEATDRVFVVRAGA